MIIQTDRQQKSQSDRYRPNLGGVELLALLANSDSDRKFEILLDVVVVWKIQHFWLLDWEDLRLVSCWTAIPGGARLTVGKPHAKWLREKS